MTISPLESDNLTKFEPHQFPACDEPVFRSIDCRNQISFSRLSYFGKMRRCPESIVVKDSPLIQALVRTLSREKIAPGFWRSDEAIAALNKTARIVIDLKNEFWKCADSKFTFSQSQNSERLFERLYPPSSCFERATNQLLTLRVSASSTLFSRFFFGDFWLDDSFSPQKNLNQFFSFDDLLRDKSKLSDLIKSACNSRSCLHSKMLTDAILIHTLQKNGYFPALLPDQLPYRLWDLAHQTLKGDEYTALNLSTGWGGCLISAAAWAHHHPKVQVHLISCNLNENNLKSLTLVSKFLKDNFQVPNFQSEQFSGSFENYKTLKKVADFAALKNRILIGSVPPINRHLFQKQIPQCDTRRDDSKIYELWRLYFLQPLIANSALFLLNAKTPSIAFWNISKKIPRSDHYPMADSAAIWKSCGFEPLATLLLDTDSPSNGNLIDSETVLIIAHQIDLTSNKFAERLAPIDSKSAQRPSSDSKADRHDSSAAKARSSMNKNYSSANPLTEVSAFNETIKSRVGDQIAQQKDAALLKKGEVGSKRSLGGMSNRDEHLSKKTNVKPMARTQDVLTSFQEYPSVNQFAPELNGSSQSILTIGPLQNQLALYPSRPALSQPTPVSDQARPSPSSFKRPHQTDHLNENRDRAMHYPTNRINSQSNQPDLLLSPGGSQNRHLVIDHSSENGSDRRLSSEESADLKHVTKNRVEALNLKKLKDAHPQIWERVKSTYGPYHPSIIKQFDEMMAANPGRYRSYRARTFEEIKKLPNLNENGKHKKPENHCIDYFIQNYREHFFVRELPESSVSECGLIENKYSKFTVSGREFYSE